MTENVPEVVESIPPVSIHPSFPLILFPLVQLITYKQSTSLINNFAVKIDDSLRKQSTGRFFGLNVLMHSLYLSDRREKDVGRRSLVRV